MHQVPVSLRPSACAATLIVSASCPVGAQIQRPLPGHLHQGADRDQAQTQLPQVPFTLGTTVPPAGTVACCRIFAFCALLIFMSFHWLWHFGG